MAAYKHHAHRQITLPALHRLSVEPELEHAEPVEARPEIDMAPQSPMERRQSEEGRARAEYGERRQAYSLSVHDQEPAIPRVINTAISWDQAHGVRPIDSLKQERKAAETELAEIGDGHPEKLGDFTVGDKEKAGAAPDGEQTQETSVLEREALKDGLTLVPEDDASAGSSSLVNRGLSQDGAWEAREGLKPVSTKRRVVSPDSRCVVCVGGYPDRRNTDQAWVVFEGSSSNDIR